MTLEMRARSSKSNQLSLSYIYASFGMINQVIQKISFIKDCDLENEVVAQISLSQYSRTSVARTRMARLPRLFRTRSLVPWKKIHSCTF